jgi:hypothetical protein
MAGKTTKKVKRILTNEKKVKNYSATRESPPIDAVIAWVDGSDTALARKRNRYLSGPSHVGRPEAAPTRFACCNEIRYCVLSILKFAPFIRNIFIVTDGQDPGLDEEIRTHFPERLESIRIVDHKEIFEGYEQYLPTFNSISIGNMIWRIKGLSEHFVYFNDDVFLIRPVKPQDWVKNNRSVMRGKWMFPPFIKMAKNFFRKIIHRKLRNNPGYTPKFSFYLVQWNAATLAGMNSRFFFNCHTPHVLNRKRLEAFFSQNKSLLKENISYRFRNQKQFNVTTLANHLEILDGNDNTARLNLGYLVPSYYSKRRLKLKMRRCEKDERIQSVCVQSLDAVSREEQKRIFSWMDQILRLETSATA